MQEAHFHEFLSEKQRLEDFLMTLREELNTSLEDFEKVSIEKLTWLLDLINDNESLAIIIGNEFYKDFIQFQADFNRFVKTFEEIKRFKMEITLEGFLDRIDILQKDLLK
ncbi:MAG: hypothetical protein K940chlam1_01169 [Candidatus Anoxychlamydiales bacterium]|nr:hypothetical protein [Candidatus Anoxychlamydiales bacterium]NGX35371.1 hypothetical protein [Candidatus Anoxychlamydiales bacterium]